jgi:hypothetical protein
VATEWIGPVTVYVSDAAAVAQARGIAAALAPHGADTVTVEQMGPLRTGHRFNDLKPLTAGDRIHSATGIFANGASGHAQCTSAFGGRSSDNRRWMITAHHCVRPGDPRFWADGSGATYDGAAVLDPAHDIAYIEMCNSGSFSGIRCYSHLSGSGHFTLEQVWRDVPAHDVFMFFADSDDGTSNGGEGDSGGPVFEPLGGIDVRAVGMYSAGDDDRRATCVGEGGRTCWRRMYFTNVDAEAVVNHHLNLVNV